MNLILFSEDETRRKLPPADPRTAHILNVLGLRTGGVFDAGIVNGPRGKARVAALDDGGLSLEFSWTTPRAAPDPITLIVGLPRPQTARKILREAAALGVAQIHFAKAGKTDASYARSGLWASGEWRRHLVAGAEQAFATDVPEVSFTETLAALLGRLPPACPARVALDNYEAEAPLAGFFAGAAAACPCVIAIGGERGWDAADRALLRAAGFRLASLGGRVLRVETAVVAALALAKAARGVWR
ncbi:MAG: 16S rRNA (uracil(1498)-N(3))-methyltransferase [Opitutaceae bacterium]|jgi:RsmE family RNA methyltransferase|nr:16S rRNA (uracil(1498)-N(3))-methyltransferase [Opitutaceae bacterium]